MKDILITAAPRSNRDLDICAKITKDMTEYGKAVQKLHETAWLMTGQQSFEIATKTLCTLSGTSVQYAVVEVESVLLAPAAE